MHPEEIAMKDSQERLESWKEIGAYLQRDARTAQRWEKEEGLPVHRHPHSRRSSVYAYPSEIDAWRAGRSLAAQPAPALRPWWRPVPVGITTLLCLIMVGNGIRPKVASAQQERGPHARQVWAGVNPINPWVSTDGRYLSFSDPSSRALMIRDLRTGASRRLTTAPGSAGYSAISPDGRQVAYAWRDTSGKLELRVLPLAGQESISPRVIYRNEQTTSLEPSGWTPDGKQLLVKQILGDRTNRLAMISVQDGSIHVLKSFGWGVLDNHASLSPDGRYVAYGALSETGRGQSLYVLAVDGSRENKITDGAATDFMVQWSADGSQLLFLSDRTGDDLSLWSVPVEEGKVKGPATLVKANTGDVVLIRNTTTRDGSLYYVTDLGRRNVYIADLDEELRAIKPPAPATQRFINSTNGGSWSPDGQYLAFYRTNYITGSKLAIRTLKTGAEREVPVQLRIPPYPSVAPPQWFPDGRSVLVVSYVQERGIGYHRVNIQTGDEQLLHHPKSPNLALAMTPVLVVSS